MKIAFCTAEAFPFAKVGGLGDVCGALPLALEKLGEEVVVILPAYGTIDRFQHKIKKISDDCLMTTIGKGIEVYFVENEQLFNRDGIYGGRAGSYPDNLERYQYFCKQVFVVLKQQKKKIDLFHCHDWHAALIPVYLKSRQGAAFAGTPSVMTIHNLAYQGIFPRESFPKLELEDKWFTQNGFEYFGQINILKAGILYSDLVSTVSPRYAREIQAEEFGCGLDGVLKSRGQAVQGILNGVDYSVWNPQTDSLLTRNYSPADLSGKAANKEHLQALAGFPVKADVPVFGFVGRLSSQKGLDLLAKTMDQMMHMDVQMVFLGVGEEKYHTMLRDMARQYKEKLAVFLEFDETKAHAIYAGSDMFLMPSHFEPCGLGQIISLKYGAIPLVFKTGGLADTITPHDAAGGNGFVFADYTRDALMEAFKTAVKTFSDAKAFRALQVRAMSCDFSWEKSALEYQKLYRQHLAKV